jgi:hypothetical protein
MAYETGTATGIGDLVDKLSTFAQGLSTTPWTEDELDIVTKLQGTLHRGNCYVTFRWDGTVETDLGLYQSLGWVTSSDAHQMTDDSGNGDTSVPINAERRVNFGSTGPFTAYHFFAGEGDEPYIYVVVEVSSGIFRHFGFGNLKKFGTWTGGEFVYGHLMYTVDPDGILSSGHSFLLDGLTSSTSECATMHAEGLPRQGVNEKWVCFTNRNTTSGTDTAGEDRQTIIGCSRQGGWGAYLSWMRYSSPNAFKPLFPIMIWDLDTSQNPVIYRYLGEMPDISLVNMHAFTPGQEITVGGDTWMVFPWIRKRFEEDNNQESANGGVAYKKVT